MRTIAQNQVGRRAWWHVGGLAIDVTILAVSGAASNAPRYLVTAPAGDAWIAGAELTILPIEFAPADALVAVELV